MKREFEGFILKGSAFDRNNQLHIKLYGQSVHGPFEILFDNLEQYFFKTSFKGKEFKTLDKIPAEKVYFKSLKQKKEFKEQLDSEQITTYEFDIRPIDRFLMDLGIYGSVKIIGESITRNSKLFLKNPIISPQEYYPKVSVFSFDIETAKDGRILSIAYHAKNYKGEEDRRVYLLSNQNIQSEEFEIINCPNEINLIQSFKRKILELDPDIIIGWNVIGFDLKYIFDRAEKFKIDFNISRDEFDAKMFQNARGEWTVDISGRVVIDGPRTLKMNFFNFESFKLNEVAKVLLGETKDIDEDEVFDKWGEIERRYKEDQVALCRYNLKDTELVSRIFDKTHLIDLLLNRSIISGMLLEKVGGSTAAFDHFFLPRLHDYGYCAPNVVDVEWDKEAKGGFVLNPKIGIHENVAVLDFKSLYPTVIRTFGIDPLSRLESNEDFIKTPVGIKFSREKHILPNKISELLDRRAKAKLDKNENLSMAVKILMNSFYGVMGSSGCRFYHHELPDAITGTGQWVLKTTIQFLESLGHEILYGDTDSIFVKLNSNQNLDSNAKELVSKVNVFLKETILRDYQLNSFLEIQQDKIFKKLILTPTRQNDEGAKKRYAGLLMGAEEKIVLTGMEFVRSDWSKLAKNFQYELVRRIFNDEDLKDYILSFIKDLEAGKFDQDLVLRKRLTKPIEEYVKSIPPHVKALRILFDKLGIIKKQAEYVMTLRGPMPIELSPKDFDYNYYVEKQIAPIANSLLPLVDMDFDSLRNNQLSLF